MLGANQKRFDEMNLVEALSFESVVGKRLTEYAGVVPLPAPGTLNAETAASVSAENPSAMTRGIDPALHARFR